MEDKIIDIQTTVNLPNTGSNTNTNVSTYDDKSLNTEILTGKKKSLANLKPYKKGESGNKKGKPKGAASFPHAVDRVLEKQRIDKIAEVLVATAESGSHRSIETILRLGQAHGYTDKNIPTNQVNINNNTLNISSEVIELAKQILKDRTEPKKLN